MPKLTMVCGMVCAGKTTRAKQIETATDALRFCPDEWLVELVGSRTDRAGLDGMRDAVQRVQWQTAQQALRRGLDVVLEFGFWRRDERLAINDWALQNGIETELIFLDVGRETLLRRIAQRNANGGGFDIPINPVELDEWLTWIEPPLADELAQYSQAFVTR